MSKLPKDARPMLRFPSFSKPWQSSKLEDISVDGFSNGVFNDPEKVGSGYRLVNVKDMYVGDRIIVDNLTLLDLSEKDFKKNQVHFGDIFFTRSSLVKEGIAWSNVMLDDAEDVTYDGHLIKMSPDMNKIDPYFLSRVLRTPTLRRQIVARGKTGTMTTIGQNDMASVVAFYPNLSEQRKIAVFFSAVDTKLDALRRKRELLAEYKRGVMQKLFSQEIRFVRDDGRPFPDWEHKKLAVICEVGSSTRVHQKDWTSSGIPFYRAREVIKLMNGEPIQDPIFISEEKYLEITKSYPVPKIDDLLVTGVGTIGVPYIVPNDLPFYFKDGNLLWLSEIRADSRWVYHCLLNPVVMKNIHNEVGSTVKTFTIKQAKDLVIPIPSLQEQQKITNFVAAIDNKIAFVDQQIEHMETFKKGLLQQMFV